MIDPDDLALLAKSFDAAMQQTAERAEVDATLHQLGWPDLLAAAPGQGAAAAFSLLGSTGSAATLLDDVVLAAAGLPIALDTCVVLPRPAGAAAPGTPAGGRTVVDGLVSARIDSARSVVVPVARDGRVVLVDVDASAVRVPPAETLDPSSPFRVVRCSLDLGDGDDRQRADWPNVVAHARCALAHQLIGASRRMLELARIHAVDRVQFGHPIGSFQAVRHKLADSLLAIEAAAAVADVAAEQHHQLSSAVAKSLAGRAARVTAANAQQVLAGIGFTTEHPFHLFMKRTMVLDLLFGSARTLPAEIGRTLLAQRAAPRIVEL